MTDDAMDARLRAAGERWRSANATGVDVAVAEDEAAQYVQSTPTPRPRRHWGLIMSAAAVACALAVGGTLLLRSGTDPSPSGDTAALEGHVWLLRGATGTSSRATLYIGRDGELVADDECRLVTGHATTSGRAVTVTDLVVRDKACTDEGAPNFGAAKPVLSGTSSFSLTGDGLTISKGGTDLRFSLAPATTPVPTSDYPTFADSTWTLVDIHVGSASQSFTGAPAIRFSHDGTYSGDDGCNHITGSWRLDGARLTATVGSTDAYCRSSNAVMSVLSNKPTVTVAGAQLTIGVHGATLTYRWTPPSGSAATFAGTTWHLADGAGTAVPADATVRVDNGSADLGGGCRVGLEIRPGAYEVTHATGCAPSDALVEWLGSGWRLWRIQDGRLVLYDGGAQAFALVFATASPTHDLPLQGTQWQLQTAVAANGARSPGKNQSLVIKNGQLVAGDGVNTISGPVTVDGATLRLGELAGTAIGGTVDDPTTDVVDAVLAGKQVTYAISGNVLTLTAPSGARLLYGVTPPVAAVPLDGTWQLTTVEQGGGSNSTASEAGAGVHLIVRGSTADLTVDGCLVSRYALAVAGAHLTWTLRPTPQPGCAVQASAPELAQVQGVLTGDTTYRIDATNLTINKAGVGALQFASAGTTASLVGSWQFVVPGASMAVDESFTLDSTGRLTLQHACYELRRTATVGAGTITVTGDQRVEHSCPYVAKALQQARAKFDAALDRVLSGTSSWSLVGGVLTITHGGDAMTFERG